MIAGVLLVSAAACAAGLLGPADLTDPKRWTPAEGAPPAEAVTVDGKPAIRLPVPFSRLAGWRYAWDLELERDLAPHRWIRLRVKAENPAVLSGVLLYFESGDGWYSASAGGHDANWRNLRFARTEFKSEGKPGPWSAVRRMRVSLSPADRRDGALIISGLEGTSALDIDDAFRIGPWQGRDEVRAAFTGSTLLADAWPRAEKLLAKAAGSADIAAPEPQAALGEARRILVEAYARAQAPKPGEFRGIWCHTGDAYGMEWPKVVDTLAANGISAVFPNMLWSGAAYYPSKVVPVVPVVKEKGDQLKILLDAAHAKGIQVHVWKVCWQLGWMADPSVAVPFRFAGRMQVDRDGKQGEWLCPSNAANRKYELDAIREVVARYPIDGFQLDYIRYAGDEWCFCPSCKRNFEEGLGKVLKDWPKPVVKGGKYEAKYRDWRRDVITSFVLKVRRTIRDVRPSCKLSAAVFAVAEHARDGVLQDWPRWVRDGLLDFVCPMNYSDSYGEMRGRLEGELSEVRGKVPVYVGLYATYGPGRDQAPDMAVAQIAAARELGASGFVLFELEEQVLRDLLPVLRMGITAE